MGRKDFVKVCSFVGIEFERLDTGVLQCLHSTDIKVVAQGLEYAAEETVCSAQDGNDIPFPVFQHMFAQNFVAMLQQDAVFFRIMKCRYLPHHKGEKLFIRHRDL